VWVNGEAKAAAIGAAMPIAEPMANMICNIGGGTTEVAILSLGKCVALESVRCGGDRMDRAIVDYLRRHFRLKVGQQAAEKLRLDIGSAFTLEEELADEINGIDTASGLPRRATITSDELRRALEGPLDEIVEAIRAALDGCGPELAADLVEHGMVLCGGTALLRRIDRYLAQHTGIPVRLDGAPLTTVVRGLSICMENRRQWRNEIHSEDEDL